MSIGAWLAAARLAAIVLGAIALYELVRFAFLRTLRNRLHASVRTYVRRHGIDVDRFKFANRLYVKQELLNDPVIARAVAAHAEQTGEGAEATRQRVEAYVDEIVPFFNLATYFRMGLAVARAALSLLYDVVVDRGALARLDKRPAAVRIFLANHRSNADYVVMAYALRRHIAISYAVGEWARVWPLEGIFKSFGGYFVRRGHREALYHTVLSRYVQLISRHGVTQGIFLEGGLSRDGRMRPPRTGLLAYILRLMADPDCRGDVVFVPVGLNFDRVLEDRSLIGEARGRRERATLPVRLMSLARTSSWVVVAAAWNAVRWMTGQLKRNGYAGVSFGDAVGFGAWLEARGVTREAFAALPEDGYRDLVREFARTLHEAVARAVPATPVPLVCAALLRLRTGGLWPRPGDHLPPGVTGSPWAAETFAVARADLVQEVARLRESLVAEGRPVLEGREYADLAGERDALLTSRETRRAELLDVDRSIVEADAAARATDAALSLLARRKALHAVDGGRTVRVEPSGVELVVYYANALAPPDPGTAEK
jgi:glycerol-3-phosphate O-acyltransferase